MITSDIFKHLRDDKKHLHSEILQFVDKKNLNPSKIDVCVNNLQRSEIEKAKLVAFFKDLLPAFCDMSDFEKVQSYGIAFESCIHFMSRQTDKSEFLDWLEQALRDEFVLNGESYWYFHNLANLSENREPMNDASHRYFALAAQLMSAFDVYHMSNGASSMRNTNDMLTSFRNNKQSQFSVQRQINLKSLDQYSEYKKIFVTCADSSYFKKFSKIFLNSVKKNSSDVLSHIHIINPDNEAMELAKAYESEFNVSFSSEVIKFPKSASDKTLRAYYTTPRFTILNDLLSVFPNAEFLVSDIDLAIVQDVDNFFEICGTYDLALSSGILSQNGYYSYNRVAAGLSYFSNSKLAHEFIEFLSYYIKTVFNFMPQSKNWLIDQIALWKSLEALNLVGESSKVGKISIRMLAELAQDFKGGKEAFAKQSV